MHSAALNRFLLRSAEEQALLLTFFCYMIGWWTAGNQIISSVLARPFSFGGYLEVDDIRALGGACTLTHTICKRIL